MLEQSAINALPGHWCKGNRNYNGKFIVLPSSKEFQQVKELIDVCTEYEYTIAKLKRVQDVNFYAKFLLKREQMVTYQENSYMRRMFVVMPYKDLANALDSNLDHRRLSMESVDMVEQLVEDIPDDCVLLIVKVLYACYDELATWHEPGFSSELYIEYIVEFE